MKIKKIIQIDLQEQECEYKQSPVKTSHFTRRPSLKRLSNMQLFEWGNIKFSKTVRPSL